MAPLRILVADDDAWMLHMVTTVLEKRGYSVEVACDGEEALEKALANPPDLVITDVMMPRLDGWALVKTLRARPEFNFVPVIFLSALSSDDDRIRGFRLGADDYLPKPFRFEELDLRVAKTLRHREMVEQHARGQVNTPPTPTPAEEATLGGKLGEVGLSSLLTLLDMERKSGVLTIRNDATDQTGFVCLRDGRIVTASLDSRASPMNEECIYELLGWSSGEFHFEQGEVTDDDQIGQTTMHLLLEGARRIDED